MNKKKFIVNNIKFLNKDHQVYLYDIIKFNSHASNTNGFFFQLSEMDEKSIDDIYDFTVKIISAKKNLDDLERMELRDDLIKGLKVEESNNTIEVIKQNKDNYNDISVVISEHKIYNMEEIEGRMKDVFKNKKYKVDSIFFKLDKQMKMAKKNNRVLLPKLSADIRHDTLAPSGNSDFDIENTDEDMDNNEDETDPVGDEDIEATEAVGDDDDEADATEPGDDEDDEADIDVTEDIDEDEDIDEELDEERFRMLLLSKGYNVTDHSQLKEEPYNYHLEP